MYNIDWSDDIATENVKEQFATLRPVFRLRLLHRIFPRYFLKTHKKFLHLQRSWKHQNWYGDLKCSKNLKNSDWIKILGTVLSRTSTLEIFKLRTSVTHAQEISPTTKDVGVKRENDF